MLKIFCEIFEKKNRINQASLSKRTCVLNEISKFHKKISNLFFKNFQKLKMKFEIFCEIFEKNQNQSKKVK